MKKTVLYRSKYFSVLSLIALALLTTCKSDENQPEERTIEQNVTLSHDTIPTDTVMTYVAQIESDSLDITYQFGQGNDIHWDWEPDNFDTISEANFLNLKRDFSPAVNTDSSKAIFTDSTFILETAKARLSYKLRTKPYANSTHYVNYLGFIEPFNLYLINSWAEGEILSGSMSMIDSASNINYCVESTSDGPTEMPIASHDGKYLLVYSSNYHYSNITVLERVVMPGETGNFVEVCTFSIKGLIQDIGWLADNRIRFKLRNQNYFNKNLPKTGYYRSKKPINELKWPENPYWENNQLREN